MSSSLVLPFSNAPSGARGFPLDGLGALAGLAKIFERHPLLASCEFEALIVVNLRSGAMSVKARPAKAEFSPARLGEPPADTLGAERELSAWACALGPDKLRGLKGPIERPRPGESALEALARQALGPERFAQWEQEQLGSSACLSTGRRGRAL